MNDIKTSRVEAKKPKPIKTLGPMGIDFRANPGPGIHRKIADRLTIIISKLTSFLPFEHFDLYVSVNNLMNPIEDNNPIITNIIATAPVKNELNTFNVTDILCCNSAMLLIIWL